MVMTRAKTAPWTLLLTLAAGACRHEYVTCGGNHVLGKPSDVKTVPGAYDGYEVIKDCPASGAQFGVHGLASWSADRRSAYQLCAAINRPGTVQGCAETDNACTTEGGIMSVSDWRAVDSIIEQLGRSLKDDNSYREIAIRVEAPPCE
jgi:hypothetical protein